MRKGLMLIVIMTAFISSYGCVAYTDHSYDRDRGEYGDRDRQEYKDRDGDRNRQEYKDRDSHREEYMDRDRLPINPATGHPFDPNDPAYGDWLMNQRMNSRDGGS